MGMIDYGWYLFVDLVCTNAAREGARTATTYPGACPNAAAQSAGVAAASRAMTAALPASYSPTVNATCATVSGSPQFDLTISLTFPQLTGFSMIPMPGGVSGSGLVQTSATMRGE
jgi:hypothetical protein